MRYSIGFLILFLHCGLIPFQPPAPKKIEISKEQFKGEAERRASYLALLPPDVKHMVEGYAYQGLENAIVAIRQQYLSDPSTKDAFLNSEHLNTRIINDLSIRFPEYKQFMIAIMLNTPASLGLSFGLDRQIFVINVDRYGRNWDLWKNYYERFFNMMYVSQEVIQKYLQNGAMDYQEAITYINNFLNNLYQIHIQFQRQSYSENLQKKFNDYYQSIVSSLVVSLLDKFEKELSVQKMPELKVILDLDSSLVRKLLKAHTPLNNPIIARYIKKNKFWSSANGLAAFQKQLIEEWTIVLLNALKNQDATKIGLLLGSVGTSKESLNPLFKEYFNAQIKTPLINYLFNVENIAGLKNNFPGSQLSDLLSDLLINAIHNERSTPEKILQWMNAARIDLDFKAAMPLKEDLAGALAARGSTSQGGYYVMHGSGIINQYERALEMQKYGIELLLAVASSARMNGEVLQYLLNHGADANGADKDGITILMHAIKNKHFDMAAALLNQPGINVNACDRNGWETALSNAQMLPASEQKEILIATLKERGAKEEGTCAIQ